MVMVVCGSSGETVVATCSCSNDGAKPQRWRRETTLVVVVVVRQQ